MPEYEAAQEVSHAPGCSLGKPSWKPYPFICPELMRQARSIELNPRCCDVIVWGWQDYPRTAATLDGDGRRFEEIAAGREAAAA